MVISAAILTKSGKTLVARQFVEISRPRIEGLLAAFPKLLGADGAKKQHTFIETPSVRYVYQPMEELYVIVSERAREGTHAHMRYWVATTHRRALKQVHGRHHEQVFQHP